MLFYSIFISGGIHLLRPQNFRDFGPPPVHFFGLNHKTKFTQPRLLRSLLGTLPLSANVINGSPLMSPEYNLPTWTKLHHCQNLLRKPGPALTQGWFARSPLSCSYALCLRLHFPVDLTRPPFLLCSGLCLASAQKTSLGSATSSPSGMHYRK